MEITPVERNAQQMPAVASAAAVQSPVEKREVIQAVKAVNASEMLGEDNELVFQRDRTTQRMVIRLVDRKTGDVISQLPPEYVLRMAKSMNSGA
jgi:uncharacterized FlaG/YvyC family protein